MNYEPGNMGVAEGLSLAFMVSFATSFLSISAITVDIIKTAAWMQPLVTGGCSLALLLAYLAVAKRFGEQDLLAVAESLLGKPIAWLIGAYYCVMFFIEATLLLRQFAENTLLTATPDTDFSLVIFFFVSVTAISLFFSIEPVARTAYIVLPPLLVGISLVLMMLSPRYQLLQLTPWQGSGLENVLWHSLPLSGIFLGVWIIPLLGRSFQNTRTMRQTALYGLGLAMLCRCVMLTGFLLTFGVMTGREKVLPFFEMTKLVYTSRYLQRIESLFIMLWIMTGIIAIVIYLFVGLYLLARLWRLPSIKPLVIPAAILVAQAAMVPGDMTTVIKLHHTAISTVYNIGVFAIPALLVLTGLVKGRRKQACAAN